MRAARVSRFGDWQIYARGVDPDGAGMESGKIKEKAVQKGLITANQDAKMSDREELNLVFQAGFVK